MRSGRQTTPPASRGRVRVFATSGLVVCLVLLATAMVVRAENRQHGANTRAGIESIASGLRAATEQALAAQGALTEAVGALVDEDGTVDAAQFQNLAARLLAIHEGTRALELAPDGIIQYVHPLVGNEGAVGLNLNQHVSGAPSMQALRDGQRVVVEGPVQLVQGGQAVVIRSRVEVPGPQPTSPRQFWGAAINVIDLGTLLRQTGLADLNDLQWSLHRGEGVVSMQDLILGQIVTTEDPVEVDIHLPGGTWTLSLAPADGWPGGSPMAGVLTATGLLMAVLLALLAGRLVSEPLRLRARVDEASSKLQRSHAQTAAIMNTAADAILAIDGHGQVVASNPAAARLLRLTDAELAATDLTRHVAIGRVPLEAGIDGSRMGRARMTVTRSDDSIFPAEVSVARSADEDLQTVIIRDVSDAQQREEDLQHHVLELERLREEHSAIDAVKRDFMSMASHEVRTPITAIRGFALTLNRHWDQLTDEDRKRSLDVIHRQATRLWHLVSDVLTTSQLEGGALDARVTPVHLQSTIERAVIEAQVPPAAVRIDCEPHLTARLDAGHLVRILVALLTNAYKYGQAPIHVRVSVDGTDLVVRVIDHGPGVPFAFRDRLFEPFSQASTGVTREAVGTGLGLAVARGLARASGGDVWHEERHDAGAVFAVRIPRATPTADDAPAGATEPEPQRAPVEPVTEVGAPPTPPVSDLPAHEVDATLHA